ncbi:MAG: flagellin FliC [Candidatus Hydrogenedentes bacterium]|nr:flagellin FliC [Candidatus Hydrogenedentota bacterium]
MGVRINTNIPALNAQRQTEQSSNRLIQGLGNLATGLRINRAAQDAAGLALAERLRTEILQSNQEIGNLQAGINVVQTAEGGLEAQQEGAQRLRELAVQAANGTLTEDQRAAVNAEAQQILQQIGEVADNTEFNGTQLLNGTAGTIPLGTEAGEQVNINASTPEALGLNGLNLSTTESAGNAIEAIDTALNRISQNRAALGAQEERFTRGIEQRQTAIESQEEARSRVRDLDEARQAIEQTRNQVLQRTGIAALIQANVTPQAAARLLGS